MKTIDSGILQTLLRAFWPLLALDGTLILACCAMVFDTSSPMHV